MAFNSLSTQDTRSRDEQITRDLSNAITSCVTVFNFFVSKQALGLSHSQQMYPSSCVRISQTDQPPPAQRRHPLTNAANLVNHQETPPKPLPKAPASPPLPRQNPKVTPPSPPNIITDKSGKLQFHRVGFLGEVCSSVVQIDKLCVSDETLFRVVLHGFTK